jgi:signal transduction histidine kinase
VFFLVLGVAGAVLWGATGMVARRLTRPLGEVARVADAIGSGQLSTRVTLRRNRVGEIAVLADAINEMADRIERQMADQRELLAAVSHEIRSPLARLRVLSEMARDGGADAQVVDEIEQEVLEIDSLVGELLASSRLDFEAVERRPLDAREIATRALERSGLAQDLLAVETDATAFTADPTLVARALANLLDNARKHAGGATRLLVRRDGDALLFAVEYAGAGIAESDLPRVFEKFVRGERSGGSSLGLGLSLVRRIAEAHGGRALAENLPSGGARVGFTLAHQSESPLA